MKNTRDYGQYIAELMNMDKSTLPPDGGERFNRLIFARSPYLLQHSENPVDWYEWGEEAFEKARTDSRPIFLSIGYATCHWCHVMAHESFEDKEVADLFNRHFVCIKVDREERPDIDDFYMTVSQLLTGSGGWPLNIFMTPERQPFMAITYLPKNSRSGVTGLTELVPKIAAIWRQRPELVEKNCKEIMEALGTISQRENQETGDLIELTRRAMEQLEELYDDQAGGFGTAPKFPMPINISYLIEQGHKGDQAAQKMALQTLRQIRAGGIWDQLGGGLHRYSVDQVWLVPHFEKMLYDQALVALVSLEAFQISGDSLFLRMAEEIFDFADRELASPEGAYCSALDADSEGVEGKFYVWSKKEVDKCLGSDSDIFCTFYDITEGGNFEVENILHTPRPLAQFCAEASLEQKETEKILARGRGLLLAQRERRIRPMRDDKVITAWNGLMIAALAKGGVISGKTERIERAAQVAEFILERLRRKDGRLLRSFLGQPSGIPAFLEDYASLMMGLLELYEATLNKDWLNKALELAEDTLRIFRDPESGQFFKVGVDVEQMPVTISLEQDGVIPSAFSLAAKCLVRLSHTCNRPDLFDFAHVLVEAPVSDAKLRPMAHLGALQALEMLEKDPVIIHFKGKKEDEQLNRLLQVTKTCLIPNLVLFFEETVHKGQAFVCSKGTCHPAVTDESALKMLLV
ncbi:MAG TPA: thioredoxin domain-containing protein [Desulfuromonadaceae bacterium]|jgi:hypothetical protein